MEAIKELYQEEINAHKEQIDNLKARNKSSDEKNAVLLEKVRSLQDLIEKADVANKDLYTAFEHVRDENLKLQTHSHTQDSIVVRTQGDELALQTVQRQYVNLASESVSWISDKDRLTQRTKFLERECERYARDNVTLGKQVRHLLKSLEEERGMIIRKSNQPIQNVGPLINASDVIDSHLVTFESIEELQKQNQKLLSLVKEMSKREEEREIQIENDDIKRLNGDIDVLKDQLEGVKNDREKIMNAFNTILKERDLFKILLCKTRQVEHLTPEIFQRMVSIACSSGPAISNLPENTQDKDAHIVDLKAMISKLEQDLSDLRSDYEAIRLKNEEELKLKTELLEQAHLKILSESQLAENLKEKNGVLETNINSLMLEFDEGRTKSQKMTFELDQLNNDKKELKAALEEEKQKRQLDIGNVDSLTKRLDEVQTRSQALAFELEHLKKDKIELKEDLEDEKYKRKLNLADVESLTKKLDEVQTRSQRLEFELEHLNKDKIELEKNLERERQEKQSAFLQEIQSRLNLRQPSQGAMKSIREFQRLRNLERARRLRTTRKLQRLSNFSSLQSRENVFEFSENVEESKVPTDSPKQEVASCDMVVSTEEIEEKRDQPDKLDEAPPVKGFVLKRRKITVQQQATQ